MAALDTKPNIARPDDFYAALMLLMDELIARPGSKQGSKLIDETMVVVVSEMGRTPLAPEAVAPLLSALAALRADILDDGGAERKCA